MTMKIVGDAKKTPTINNCHIIYVKILVPFNFYQLKRVDNRSYSLPKLTLHILSLKIYSILFT